MRGRYRPRRPLSESGKSFVPRLDDDSRAQHE